MRLHKERKNSVLTKISYILAILILVGFSFITVELINSEKCREAISVGIGYSNEGKYEQAIEEFNKALKYNSKSFEAHYELAKVCISSNKLDKAYEELEKCKQFRGKSLKLAKEYTRYYLYRGIECLKKHKLSDCEENFKMAIESNPSDIDIYLKCAQQYLDQGLLPKSIDILKQGYEKFKEETIKNKLDELLKLNVTS